MTFSNLASAPKKRRTNVCFALKSGYDPIELTCYTGVETIERKTSWLNDDNKSVLIISNNEFCVREM